MGHTNGSFQIIPGKNEKGEHIFALTVKRSYKISPLGRLERSPVDRDLRQVDEYFDAGDPGWSTIQFESELVPCKPLVDVVVIGKAYAPEKKHATHMTISVRVADRSNTIAVFGNRKCEYRPNLAPVFSQPEPFHELELRYERSYGGSDQRSNPEIPFYYPRNDMGAGVALTNSKDTIENLPLPNFEDPKDLLTPDRLIIGTPENWPAMPLPHGFGWFPRTWYPRSIYAGSYPAYVDVDTVTAEERLGLVPKRHIALAKQFKLPGYHPRFNNGASCGMLFSDLRGDERVILEGLTPDGTLQFTLPGEQPKLSLDLGEGAQKLNARLDTVSIMPDELAVDLIWRGALAYEGYSWLPQMKRLHAEIE